MLSGPLFLDDVFSDLLMPSRRFHQLSKSASPAVQMEESEKGYTMQIVMPGVRTQDIKADIDDDHVLSVSAETKTENRHVQFQRAFSLPRDADFGSEDVSLVHEDGILSVFIPKKPPHSSKRELTIRAAASKPIPIPDAST